MTGERNLNKLRRQMEPKVHSETFVYCCFPGLSVAD